MLWGGQSDCRHLSYICPPEGAWTCRTQGVSEEVLPLSGSGRNSVGPCKDGLESQVGGAGSERNGQKPGAYGNQGGS